MAINITVGSPTDEPVETPAPPAKPIAEVELQHKRSVNGDYYIPDHADIDIIILKD